MTGVVSAIFWGVVVLSLLVFVHEGGHYLAARACGVRVTEFFLGMPCRVKLSHKSRDHGTEIGVTPILLGGYTRICGMENSTDELLGAALMVVQRAGRIAVSDLAAQLGCDVDRAYGLLATLTDWAAVRPYYDSALGEHEGQSDWPASFETLRRDASLRTEYDRGHDFSQAGTTNYGEPRDPEMSADEFLAHERGRTYLGCGFWRRCAMLLAGPVVNLLVALVVVTASFMIMGVQVASNEPVIGSVSPGSFAEAAGLEAGDRITAVEGEAVSTYDDLVAAIKPYLESGTDFTLDYERDGSASETTVDLVDGQAAEYLGITNQAYTYYPSLGQALRGSAAYGGLVAEYAVKLIVPTHTMEVLDQSSSVVGISVMASEAASAGVPTLAFFIGAISMSLGFMNLLPIPPLDGGKILIEIIQAISRRQVSARAQTIVSYVGLAFFLFVFVVAMRNDIVTFVIGG
jgi:regulator of sigma E protease